MDYTIERRTGRLVEARVFRFNTASDVDGYRRAFTPAILAGRPVLLADHRPVLIYPQEVADKLIEIFSELNKYWERVAIVISPSNATFQLQVQRVVRESRNPSRRMFTSTTEACAFLAEALLPLELGRATSFLAEGTGTARESVPPPPLRLSSDAPPPSRRGQELQPPAWAPSDQVPPSRRRGS